MNKSKYWVELTYCVTVEASSKEEAERLGMEDINANPPQIGDMTLEVTFTGEPADEED